MVVMTRIFHDTDTKALLAKYCPDHPVHALYLFESVSRGWFAHDTANKVELDALVAKGLRDRSQAETRRMYALGYCYHEARALAFDLSDEIRADIERNESATLVISLPSPYASTVDVSGSDGLVIRQMLGHDVTIHIDRSCEPMRIVCHDPCQAVDFSSYAEVLKRHYADAEITVATGLKQQVRGETHCVLLAAVNAIEFSRHKRLPDRKRVGQGLADKAGLSYRMAAELDEGCLVKLRAFQQKHRDYWRWLERSLRVQVDLGMPGLKRSSLLMQESAYVCMDKACLDACRQHLATIKSVVSVDDVFALGAEAHVATVKRALRELYALLKASTGRSGALVKVLLADLEVVARDIDLELAPPSVIDLSFVC